MSELTKENILIYAGRAIEQILLMSDMHERAEHFTDIMDRAREFGKADEVEELARKTAADFNEPELWELPESFEKGLILPSFPVESFPKVIRQYVEAVAKNVQVDVDMAAVVALSVLSLCFQGKAKVSWANTEHSEHLNLYTAVIAQPSERKSGIFNKLIAPVTAFEQEENQRRAPMIKAYEYESKNLQAQLKKLEGKAGTYEQAKAIIEKQEALKPVNELALNVTDTTVEALADTMLKNGERIGILTDEGGIFDTIAGRYSNGIANLDLYLKAYDGSAVRILRKNSKVEMYNPVITMGLLVQQDVIDGMMSNTTFSGRGFVQRFLFSIPKSKVGSRNLKGEPIPQEVKANYNALIYRLLSEKYPKEIPVIHLSKEAEYLFEDFHRIIEPGLMKGGFLHEIAEWGGKLEGKTLRIAGLLHLCEHSPQEEITEKTMSDACLIGHYFINHALEVYNIMGVNPTVRAAKFVLEKLKAIGDTTISKHDLLLKCQKYNAVELEEPLQLLENMHYIKRQTGSNPKGGRPKENIKINPLTV